jgi:nitrogen regulatory protein PII
MSDATIHRRKKVEIVCERAILDDVVEWLREAGVTGHTVIPHIAGRGRQGRRDGEEASRVLENALVIAITREDVARRLLNESVERLRDFTAIVYLSDVDVARPDHF